MPGPTYLTDAVTGLVRAVSQPAQRLIAGCFDVVVLLGLSKKCPSGVNKSAPGRLRIPVQTAAAIAPRARCVCSLRPGEAVDSRGQLLRRCHGAHSAMKAQRGDRERRWVLLSPARFCLVLFRFCLGFVLDAGA